MSAFHVRRGWTWLTRPAALPWKLGRWVRLQTGAAAYCRALADDSLLAEAGPLPASGLLSVVMPVFRVSEAHLRAAVASVRGQSWADWELLIVDDGSPEPFLAPFLQEAAADPRIRVIRRPSNGGIAAASDDGVAQARGEFVAFLDDDDMLHPRALELVARFLATRPETDWLFTDEDKLDEHGRHAGPLLKPGWSRHLLLGCNVASHLRVVRHAAIAAVGGHRRGIDGAQDYDLALRILAAGGRFAHLPGPLYHWRTAPGSMARGGGVKAEANRHALAALVEHVRTFPRGGGVTAEFISTAANLFRVRRAPDPLLRVALLQATGAAVGTTAPPAFDIKLIAVPDLSPAALHAAARRSDVDVIAVWPAGGGGGAALPSLLPLLQVPGTAAVSARVVDAHRVVSSGWVIDEDGTARDPWRGLHRRDPGYLNFALLPGRRVALPPFGWVAWREAMVSAWEAGADAPEPWRLAAGWHRLGLECVCAPEVDLPASAAEFVPPVGPPPLQLPHTRFARLARIGALP